MKQHLTNILRGFACSLAASGLGALLIALMLALYDIPRTVELAILPWALLLFALSAVCEILYARGTNMLILVAVCGLSLYFGGEQVTVRTIFLPGSSGFPVLLRLLVWGSGAACAYAVHKLPPSDLFVRLADALIVSLTVYLAACFFLGDALIAPIVAFSLAALCLCLLTAASLRAGGESDRVIRGTGTGGLLILGALLSVCALLVSALLSLVSGRVNGIVDALLAAWSAIVRVVSRVFELFVRFIALFAPKPVQYNMTLSPEDSMPMSSMGVEVTAQMPRWVIWLFITFVAALALAAVIAILFALRGTKLSRAPRRKARRITRQSRMLEALLARLRALREALAFEAAYKRNRRTPQGLYILAVRRCRLTKLKKRAGESPSAFIRRLHAHLIAVSGMSTLNALADKLERALYAGESVPLSHGESDAFAAQIQALRQLSLRQKPAR